MCIRDRPHTGCIRHTCQLIKPDQKQPSPAGIFLGRFGETRGGRYGGPRAGPVGSRLELHQLLSVDRAGGMRCV